MPFGLGMGEMIIALVIILLLFGARRIPEIAGSIGKGINQFKRSVSDVEKSVTDSDTSFRPELRKTEPPVRVDDPTAEPKRLM